MRSVLGSIVLWVFSNCSGGNSLALKSLEPAKERDTSAISQPLETPELSHQNPILGSLLSDLQASKNGNYSFNFRKSSIRFYLQNPQNPNGRLLVLLPGWNYPVMDWKHKTGVVDSALAWGYRVFLCDMGKSIYMDSIYAEARADYKERATRQWLWDSVLAPLVDVVGPGKMGLMGLSTGARGAVLMGMEHQNEVGAVIALSGDYIPSLNKKDALMIHSMGNYEAQKARWDFGSNNALRLDGMPDLVFLAHGLEDRIVPVEQTEKLHAHLKYLTTTETLVFYKVNGAHDYVFWNEWGLKGLRAWSNK